MSPSNMHHSFRHSVSLSGIAESIALTCWNRDAEASASSDASASCYCLSENVRVLAVVVAELELVQVERQIFLRDIVIGADHATLEKRPERFNVVRVHFATHVFTLTVTNRLMRIGGRQKPITTVLVGRDQRDIICDGLTDESIECRRIGALDYFADHVAFAGDRADHRGLVAHLSAPDVSLLIPMAVLVLAADERFVNFDLTTEL